MNLRELLAAGVAGVAIFAAQTALAQSPYPTKPVKLVVPFLAGAAPDTVARLSGEHLAKRLGQPFIIENRTGTGGSIAAEYVAKSPADGYTLFLATDGPLVINPHIYPKLGYDPLRDFEPISIVAKAGYYMLVCPKLQVNTLADLVSLAGKRGVSYSSSGFGSNHHVVGEMLKQRGNFNMTHVPYKGASAALIDIMNCNVDTGFVSVGTILPRLKASEAALKPIAITTARRESETPNVPTLGESYSGVEMETYFAFLAPRGTPRAITDLLARELAEFAKTKAVVDRFKDMGITVVGSTPQEFAARISSDFEKYRKLARDINLKAE